MKRRYKILLWIIGALLGLLLLIFLVLPPIARYVIENNSEEWIGRSVEIDKLGINLLNGRINIKDLALYEANQDTVFFHVNHILLDINIWKLIWGTYHIEQLHIVDPFVRIIQHSDSMNFSDFMIRFPADTSAKPVDTTTPIEIRYVVEDFSISGGNIHYINHDFGADIQIVEVALDIPAVAWDDPELDLSYSLSLASGGDVKGCFQLNQQSFDYKQQVQVDSLNISFILPYLKPYLKIKKMDGTGFITMTTGGNINDPYSTAMQGQVNIQGFDLVGSAEQKWLAFNQFSIAFDSMNTNQGFAKIGDILLDGLYLKEERFDSIDSFSQLIIRNFDGYTPDGEPPDSAFIIASQSNPVILLMDYIEKMQEVVVIDSYSVKQIQLSNGKMDFVDHTLLELSSTNIDQLALDIKNISSDKNCERAKGNFSTRVERDGLIKAEFSFYAYEPFDFDATYQLKNVALVDYNPYSIWYTDYPFRKGQIFYNGTISSMNHVIKMNNKLFVKNIYLAEKVDNDVGMHLPLKLILAIIRDKEGNISLEFPVEGDLKDPKINYWNLIGQALKNLFKKIFSPPSKQLAIIYGEKVNLFKEIPFNYGQVQANKKQEEQLTKLANVMKEKSQLMLEFSQSIDTTIEIEFLACFEAKKRFLFDSINNKVLPGSITPADRKKINNLSNVNKKFNKWLDQQLANNNPELSPLEKCLGLIDNAELQKIQQVRMKKRNQMVENYLISLGILNSRFKVYTNRDPEQIPDKNRPRYLILFSIEE
ncbi:MAG: DUF748 domain-containing protein [Bacteroidales bacterium]|nr:DUF748 domain-containing protein [Bacteroidota bacterium]MBL6949075.1 DUF748 domain-containing protein [Bacteroidales bacterium]